MSSLDDLDGVLARLDRLESQDAIRRLKADYMQRCDTTPRPPFLDLFWPDAVFQGYGAAAGPPVLSGAAIDAMLSGRPNRFDFSVHYLTNESITVDGDLAMGNWKLLEPCTVDGHAGFWQGGRYRDTFLRRDGTWRMLRLELHLEFRTPYDQGWHRQQIAPLP